jgi:uncharacterized protein YjiS (DUF1127 family)
MIMGTFTLTNPATAHHTAPWLTDIMTRFNRYRLYRQTYNELSALDARQLDDLGLTRSMLKRVAFQAAYDAA